MKTTVIIWSVVFLAGLLLIVAPQVYVLTTEVSAYWGILQWLTFAGCQILGVIYLTLATKTIIQVE